MPGLLPVVPRGFVKWMLIGAVLAVVFLIASCSAPPKVQQQSPAPSRSRVTHSERTQPTAQVLEQKPKPTAKSEVPSDRHETNRVKLRRPAGYMGEVTHSDSADSLKIAITLDAGASPAPTPAILKTLKAAGLHVTFFLTGKWCEQNPELVKEIAADGHEIGNHSYSHPDLRKLSDDAIREQLSKTENLIVQLTGKSTKPLFRPPFGGRDKRVLSVAEGEGYTSVCWSLDSWDAFKKGITSQEIEKRVLDKIQGGDIVLMHCGSAPTAAALPDIIAKLQQRGFQIVKVSELTSGG